MSWKAYHKFLNVHEKPENLGWFRKLLWAIWWIGMDYRAWKRGEYRVKKWGESGRVYLRKEEKQKMDIHSKYRPDSGTIMGVGPNVNVKLTPKAELDIVIIKKDGTREEVKGLPVEVEQTPQE
jgi:hypothetical protein